MNIYQPEQDSYLMKATLEKYFKTIKSKKMNKKIKIIDMGSGSGIQAQTCRESGFNNILTADINPEAVKHLKKQGFSSIQSNLFSKLYKRKGDLLGEPLVPIRFDLIIFNPPYLPEDKLEDKESMISTTAGKKGYELIIRFLKQAKPHLDKNAVILLLFSSLSKPEIIIKTAKQLNYKLKLLNSQKLFFEKLFVYELSLD